LTRPIATVTLTALLWMGCSTTNVQSLSNGPPPPSPQFVGFDLGTSGVRVSVIQKQKQQHHPETTADGTTELQEVYSRAIPWKDGAFDDPNVWIESVESLLQDAKQALPNQSLERIQSICVSGTSATCLLVNGKNVGKPSRTQARMYNYDVIASAAGNSNNNDPIHGVRAMEQIRSFAPKQHTALSATGSLAKLLSWHDEQPLQPGERLCHQADYVALRLMSQDKVCGKAPKDNERFVCSDWHNCLKLGYNVQDLEWPTWLQDCLTSVGLDWESVLPQTVVSPGEVMGVVSPDVARRLGLNQGTIVVGGTTDSNAAFLAATAQDEVLPGTAVVSLGSTLAIKQVSTTYVENANVGVYSHRYPSSLLKKSGQEEEEESQEAWLVGGASNAGCAVLRQEQFSVEELQELSSDIDPTKESSLDYYPLTRTGERFPVADSNLQPLLEPQPDSRKDYLHGILQGISTVECNGFRAMAELGANPPQPQRIWTCGGGANNDVWTQMRQRRLREAFPRDNTHHHDDEELLHVSKAQNVEASYGAAILASAPF